MESDMKVCTKCGSEGPFYKSKVNKDGMRSECIDCARKKMKEYRESEHGRRTREKYFTSERCMRVNLKYRESEEGKRKRKAYEESEKGKAAAMKGAIRYRESEKGRRTRDEYVMPKNIRDGVNERCGKYRRENKEKIKAQRAVSMAIKKGDLTRPARCSAEGCTASENIQAHHEDYSKPLDVIWLCASHHSRLHVDRRRMT